jgi:hypothetical protein
MQMAASNTLLPDLEVRLPPSLLRSLGGQESRTRFLVRLKPDTTYERQSYKGQSYKSESYEGESYEGESTNASRRMRVDEFESYERKSPIDRREIPCEARS